MAIHASENLELDKQFETVTGGVLAKASKTRFERAYLQSDLFRVVRIASASLQSIQGRVNSLAGIFAVNIEMLVADPVQKEKKWQGWLR